jgi:hypothetical protein
MVAQRPVLSLLVVLVRHAKKLQIIKIVRGYEGKMTTINNRFYLPLLDADGDVQVVRAYGVDNIVTMARSRPPGMQETYFLSSEHLSLG